MLKADLKNRIRRGTNECSANSSSLYISNQKQATNGNCLFLIDPQYDFCDDDGALRVPGAKEDCERVAEFINFNLDSFTEIYVTMDSHMNYHIAHPCFWVDKNGNHPDPFTSITHEEIKHLSSFDAKEQAKSKWFPVDKSQYSWVADYTAELAKHRLPGLKAFTLTIWPPHCLIGTKGHNIEANISKALSNWELKNSKCVHYIIKGNNSLTEHYSAFRAEVMRDIDENTQFNTMLYRNLEPHQHIFIAGQAKSHCVNFTVRDLANKLGVHKSNEKLILLEGGMSSVGGFEEQGNEFWNEMVGSNKGSKYKLKICDISGGPVKALGSGLFST